jgi:hypothetical protein
LVISEDDDDIGLFAKHGKNEKQEKE